MRHFSFKILLLCILLPPLLYILTVQAIETHLQKGYAREVENRYLGDTRALLDGSIRLKEAVNENIDRFLRSRKLTDLGLVLKVTVTAKNGTILYPAVFSQEQDAAVSPDATATAAENFALLNDGLVLAVETKLEHLAVLPLLILFIYMFTAVAILYFHYRSVSSRLLGKEREREAEIERLRSQEESITRDLENIRLQREALNADLQQVKSELSDEKVKASRNEDEMIDEIEGLEQELRENLDHQQQQLQEIEVLKQQIQQFEKGLRKGEKQKSRAEQAAAKRFSAIYKNIDISNRAIDGFVELNEELKIKAEEVIHQLNEDPGQVIVKRKVFIGKRDKKSIMEVIFGYKGRLYFRTAGDGNVEVLAIGTKNTQTREMEYLNRL
ncbi:MAG: hypothetical protein AMJ54_15415 [Deltaproteobacteria bacterium SG8_13]|nr:MAG: hypothetical protein AMJ54_15415 [Deltaproteobacteria bacterium SG8_13]